MSEAWHNRGMARFQQGALTEAIADYTWELKLMPAKAQAWADRGTACAAKGELAGALKDFNQAIKVDAGLTLSYFGRAAV